MYSFILVFHILACLALILIVLLQTGRGAEMGAAFGGSSQTLFGSSGGTTFLGKLTTLAAVVFMVTCLGLTYFVSKPHTKSIMENVPVEQQQGPAIPEAKPVMPAPAAPAAETPAAQPSKPEATAPAPEQADVSKSEATEPSKDQGKTAPQATAPAAPAEKKSQ